MPVATSSPARASELRQQIRRVGPLGFIILLHIAFFYVLQSGLWRKVATAIPHEVVATLITPQPAAKPAPAPSPKPTPAPPKPVQKPIVTPKPTPAPVTTPTPAPTAITAPAPTPTPASESSSAASAAPAASAPVQEGPPRPKTITSGIEYIQPPSPEYPSLSRRMGEEGKVMLRILVNEKGRPEQVEIRTSSGYTRLDEAAKRAGQAALFKPRIEDGRPVPVYAIVPIVFKLD